MTATIQTIRNLIKERAAKTKPLLLAITTNQRDDEHPVQYIQRRDRELRAELDKVNHDYTKRIGEAAAEASKEPQQQLQAGSSLSAENLTESQLYVEEYRGRSRIEQRELVREIMADLAAGNTAGARVKARAAKALNIPELGRVMPQLNDADPVKRAARDRLDVIEALGELSNAELIREQASAGLLGVRESISLQEFADKRGLRADVPFPDQVDPDYGGPTVKANGVPVNPFPEPFDPERDRQREENARIGRDPVTPADTAARYAARGGRDVADGTQGDNLQLLD